MEMKATDLMIGDWVKIKGHLDYDKVQEIAKDENMQWYVSFACSATLFRAYEFEPIPLTPEILEKNGWIQCKYETCKSLYEYKGLHLRHTMIKRSNGRWVANVEGIVEKFPDEYTHSFLRINVFYVHELQHALRLCGLEELADNFKI